MCLFSLIYCCLKSKLLKLQNFLFLLISVVSATGPALNITKIKREHMGPYLCIASNGIPPSVSKRIMVVVQCKKFFCSFQILIAKLLFDFYEDWILFT